MPIVPTLNLRDLAQQEFDELDAAVMRHAYASQNRLGRLFDERIYENDLAKRLQAEGFEVRTQVPVSVAHGSFSKTYFLDLIVNQLIYELKTVSAFLPEHRAQALHYAMLHNVRRIKLLNFRTAKVQGELLYNSVTDSARRAPQFAGAEWTALSPGCTRLSGHLRALVDDWGTHLSARLYNEALVHHFGGERECLQQVAVGDLGFHAVQMHSAQHCFTVTAIKHHFEEHRRHLQCLLAQLEVKAIQWINLDRSEVRLVTLQR